MLPQVTVTQSSMSAHMEFIPSTNHCFYCFSAACSALSGLWVSASLSRPSEGPPEGWDCIWFIILSSAPSTVWHAGWAAQPTVGKWSDHYKRKLCVLLIQRQVGDGTMPSRNLMSTWAYFIASITWCWRTGLCFSHLCIPSFSIILSTLSDSQTCFYDW